MSFELSLLRFMEEQAQSASPCDRLDPVMHPQFLEDMGHMPLDGIQGNHQPTGNLLVRVAVSDQLEDFQFTFGKRFDERLLSNIPSRLS